MRTLILGSTGLLGQALVREATSRKLDFLGVATQTSPINVDITQKDELRKVIEFYRPQVVINTVACVNLLQCEQDVTMAYRVNAKPAASLAELAQDYGFYRVQISTDHYYTGDKDRKHTEDEPIKILNEYSRTKYAAEQFTLNQPKGCVLRTNIVGFRGKTGQPTFVEWVLDNLTQKAPMTLFRDFYTSSIDVDSFSRALFDLIPHQPEGILNLASSEASSKQQFIEALAERLGYDLQQAQVGSVWDSPLPFLRAESLGLDTSRAEALLGRTLPGLQEVIEQLASQARKLNKNYAHL